MEAFTSRHQLCACVWTPTDSLLVQGEVRGLKEKLKRKAGSLTSAQQDVAAKEAELEAAALHVRRMAHQEQLLQEDLASHQASCLSRACQDMMASSGGGGGGTDWCTGCTTAACIRVLQVMVLQLPV